MNHKKMIAIASFTMALGVACGAFGAHALRGAVSEHDLAIYEKAVLYHFVHALGLFLIVVVGKTLEFSQKTISMCFGIMLTGIVIFSGSLYLLVLTDTRWLGAITPLGGTAFIVAWIYFALQSLKSQ